MRRYGSALELGTAHGRGNLRYADDGVANNIFLRGATATSGAATGVFALNLGNTASAQRRSLGFRCAK